MDLFSSLPLFYEVTWETNDVQKSHVDVFAPK